MMACAARLERSGLVTQERFVVSGLLGEQGSWLNVAEGVATLPQVKGQKDFILLRA